MATELPILQCTLDHEGAKRQARRYRAVAAHVGRLERTPGSLVAEIDDGVDRELLAELIDVERACCSFFTIAYDGRRLSYSTDQTPALDVIEEALNPPP
jgi:hypothetical protein